MLDRSGLEGKLAPLVAETDRYWLFVGWTTVTALAVGYAIGRVLAGADVAAQGWVLVIVGMWVVTIATLFAETPDG